MEIPNPIAILSEPLNPLLWLLSEEGGVLPVGELLVDGVVVLGLSTLVGVALGFSRVPPSVDGVTPLDCEGDEDDGDELYWQVQC
jgi:hypothetical protein